MLDSKNRYARLDIHRWKNSLDGDGATTVATIGRVGILVLVTISLFTGGAVAHEPSSACSTGSTYEGEDVVEHEETSIDRLTALIDHLHALGVMIALPLAGLLYLVAGYYWSVGTIEAQERAKRIFINTTIGLAVIILSGALVDIVTRPLCGVTQ